MTIVCRDGEMILVHSKTLPPVEGTSVDVRPGLATTFAGDRPRGNYHVTVPGRDVRETCPHERFAKVVRIARRLVREHEATVVRLGNRRQMVSFRPVSSARDLEDRFATLASEEGATLVTWTDELLPEDPSIYDRIVEAPCSDDGSPGGSSDSGDT